MSNFYEEVPEPKTHMFHVSKGLIPWDSQNEYGQAAAIEKILEYNPSPELIEAIEELNRANNDEYGRLGKLSRADKRVLKQYAPETFSFKGWVDPYSENAPTMRVFPMRGGSIAYFPAVDKEAIQLFETPEMQRIAMQVYGPDYMKQPISIFAKEDRSDGIPIAGRMSRNRLAKIRGSYRR